MIWNMKNPEITRKKMDRGMSRLKMEFINCETEGLIWLVCGSGRERKREVVVEKAKNLRLYNVPFLHKVKCNVLLIYI